MRSAPPFQFAVCTDLGGCLVGPIRTGGGRGRNSRGMRPRRSHLKVDERDGEGLERVVVAEE
jgi:hypothetical protein